MLSVLPKIAMYRKRRGSRKFNQAAMQAGKERVRMERPVEPRPPDHSGKHAKQIIVRDLILGVEHVFDLYVSRERRDSFRVIVDGEICLIGRKGWTDTIELAGKSFVRMGSVA